MIFQNSLVTNKVRNYPIKHGYVSKNWLVLSGFRTIKTYPSMSWHEVRNIA